jgi:uncharacterized protein (TIGR03083 family)
MADMDTSWQLTIRAFDEAADAFQDLVSRVPAAAWTIPALGVWSVRDLVGHTGRAFVTIESYLAQPRGVGQPWQQRHYLRTALASDPNAIADRGRQAGQALGDDPPAAIADLADRAMSAVHAAHPDVPVATPFGGIRLRDYLPTRTFELTVHGLDLATALGLLATCPPTALEASLTLAAAIAARTGKGSELLLAATGRHQLPAGFNLLQV